MSNKIIYYIFFNFLLFEACAASIKKDSLDKVESIEFQKNFTSEIPKKDTLIKNYYNKLYAPVNIKYADTSRATILVLPGWNYSDTEWCNKTKLCIKAKKMGFDLVFVEMQRSVYLKTYYKQTRKDYTKYPTRTWLIDSAFIPLFNLKLIDNRNPVFVMGLSTGGRGAAILALDYPQVFSAAAALSGDFDPVLQKDDPLMINSLGPYTQNSKLWKGDNNMVVRASEFKVPLYIGHGIADKVSPVKQSLQFVDTLRKKNPELIVKTNFPKSAGHNYAYWDSEVDAVLKFFSSFIK